MTRARDTSQTQDNGGLAVAPYVAGKNAIINGGMDIWQRGTTTTSSGYATADRWNNLASGTTTISQESSDLPTGFQYGIKFVTSASSSFGQFKTFLERGTVIPMRGQVVTISAYVKISGGYTGSWVGQVYYSNSSDSSASVTTQVGSNFAIASSATSSWTRVSFQVTIPTDAVGLGVFFVPDSVQASGVTVRMTGVQLELGSVATPFARAGGTIQGELGACQRYYIQYTGGSAAATPVCSAFLSSTTESPGTIIFPVTMRTAPSVYYSAQADYIVTWSAGTSTTSSFNLDLAQPNAALVRIVTSGLTSGQGARHAVNTGTTKYISFGAEL